MSNEEQVADTIEMLYERLNSYNKQDLFNYGYLLESNQILCKGIEEKDKEAAKTIDFSLVVEYEIGVNKFTTANYKTEGLNDTEKAVVEVAVNYFTELLEGSIGISKSAFTLLIVSSVVDVLLLGFGVFGIVALKKSKEE